MGSGNMAHRINHRENDQAEDEPNADYAELPSRRLIDNNRTCPRKDEAKGSKGLSQILFHEFAFDQCRGLVFRVQNEKVCPSAAPETNRCASGFPCRPYG